MPTDTITLTYWEAANLYLSDDSVATLDAEFTQMYPNVTLERVAKAFNDIIATERLQASGPNHRTSWCPTAATPCSVLSSRLAS